MNKNLLIGFVVVLAALLGLPLLNSAKRSMAGGGAVASPPGPAAPREEAAAEIPEEAVPEPEIQYEEAPPPPVPAQITAQDLAGSIWEVNSEYGMIQVQLNKGGRAVASHPMAGTLNGSWRITGNQVVVKATFMNQTQTIYAQVCGTTLCVNGAPLRRLR